MSTNLQSRSASVSNGSGSNKSAGLRSASIGSSNFFNKDGLSFFNLDHSGSADDLLPEINEKGFTQETHVPSELDIVGALGTLNLDEDFEEGSGPKSPNSSTSSKEPPKSSTPFAQPQILQNVMAPHPPPNHQGSLTPQPAPVTGFGSASAVPASLNTTPSNSWNNVYVPLSAPPFAFPVEDKSAEMAMRVTPLELPDGKPEDTQLNSGAGLTHASGNEAPGPQQGMMNMSPQPLHPLGGVLDSRFAFGNFFNMSGMNFNPDSQVSGEKDNQSFPDSASIKDNKNHLPFDVAGSDPSALPHMGMPTMWNQHPQFVNPQFLSGRGQNVDARMMPSPIGQFEGGQPNFVNANAQSRFKDNGYSNYPNNSLGSVNTGNNQQRNHSGNHGSSGNYSNRRNYNMSSGVNVHRKMHNSNRRKGDDASKYANAKLEDFTGDIYSLCKDQHGCRFLQRQLDLGKEAAQKNTKGGALMTNDIAATVIFNEIYLKVVELMTDPFGNYLIQKLAENVSPDQRLILVKNAAPEFVRIALDPHGTRALQKLIECISTPEEIQHVIESLAPHIVTLSRDLNGNHVVQKCLQKLSPDHNLFIFDTTSAHCTDIATHRHGCCVLQRCLDHGNDDQRKQLSLKVAENATRLASDPFGNYVVQYVLSRGDAESIEIILDHIRSNIIALSLHKFGSNVIEKSLRIDALTDRVMEVLLNKSDKFPLLLNDPYGNYVLQTSLDVASSSDLAKLAISLQPLLPGIKNTPHGRRIMTKIQNIL